MIQNHRKQSGFTLVELMLAMGGIAFLLLFVLFAIVHATNLYSKGVAIRQINQVGRQISDELSREIRYGGKPKLTSSNRLCVGTKSYVWNTSADPDVNKKANGTSVGFVRIDSAGFCDTSSPAIPNATPELLGNVARLVDMTIVESNTNSGIYEIRMVFGTAVELPTLQPLSGRYECPVLGGQYCAVGEYEAIVYARVKGD